jgi:gas vesicle protein
MHSKKDNTLALLGGAALGAVAMYLLDPETGDQRRRDLAEKTGDARHRAGETLEPLWDRMSETARTFGSSLASGASAFGHSAADKLDQMRSGTTHAASHLGGQASDMASNLTDSLKRAGQRARDAAKTPAHWFEPEPEPSHAGAYAATGIGAILLGAAAMYMLDPERGRARRNKIVEQATSVIRRTGRSASQFGKDIRNRTTGYAHEARSAFETEDAVSADKLLQTIRSEMGHVVSHAARQSPRERG